MDIGNVVLIAGLILTCLTILGLATKAAFSLFKIGRSLEEFKGKLDVLNQQAEEGAQKLREHEESFSHISKEMEKRVYEERKEWQKKQEEIQSKILEEILRLERR